MVGSEFGLNYMNLSFLILTTQADACDVKVLGHAQTMDFTLRKNPLWNLHLKSTHSAQILYVDFINVAPDFTAFLDVDLPHFNGLQSGIRVSVRN